MSAVDLVAGDCYVRAYSGFRSTAHGIISGIIIIMEPRLDTPGALNSIQIPFSSAFPTCFRVTRSRSAVTSATDFRSCAKHRRNRATFSNEFSFAFGNRRRVRSDFSSERRFGDYSQAIIANRRSVDGAGVSVGGFVLVFQRELSGRDAERRGIARRIGSPTTARSSVHGQGVPYVFRARATRP